MLRISAAASTGAARGAGAGGPAARAGAAADGAHEEAALAPRLDQTLRLQLVVGGDHGLGLTPWRARAVAHRRQARARLPAGAGAMRCGDMRCASCSASVAPAPRARRPAAKACGAVVVHVYRHGRAVQMHDLCGQVYCHCTARLPRLAACTAPRDPADPPHDVARRGLRCVAASPRPLGDLRADLADDAPGRSASRRAAVAAVRSSPPAARRWPACCRSPTCCCGRARRGRRARTGARSR